jgi:hypothetical protein
VCPCVDGGIEESSRGRNRHDFEGGNEDIKGSQILDRENSSGYRGPVDLLRVLDLCNGPGNRITTARIKDRWLLCRLSCCGRLLEKNVEQLHCNIGMLSSVVNDNTINSHGEWGK